MRESFSVGVRFAPSPTGRFHLGNLRTAWISHEWARALGEPWVVRFEDIDIPRVVPSARDDQLADLKAFGLIPDQIVLQSGRRNRHFELFKKAVLEGALYPCICSRKEVQDALDGIASAPHIPPPIYTGQCRPPVSTIPAQRFPKGGVAWRFRFDDVTGAQDFIVARTASPEVDEISFVPSYHWACAIDDFDGNYSLLVRAWDLATSLPLQRTIHEWITRSAATPRLPSAVFHTALIVQNDGRRLEKRTPGVTLTELNSGGWSAKRILDRFRTSFDFERRELEQGSVSGEANREMALSVLGIEI